VTRITRLSLVFCLLVSVILLGGGASVASAQNLRKIVIFQDSTLLADQQQVVAQSGGSVVHILSLINAWAVQLPAVGTAEALAFLQGNPLVQGVYDDLVGMVDGGSHPICIASALPPVPQSYPWGLQTIDVPAVHPQWQGSGVTVAVLDTGIDVSHPELSPRIIGGYNARAGEVLYVDDNGHGTHMAGIIAADLNNPVAGIIGVAPQASFLAVKVLDQYGAGYLSDLIAGLQWVSNNGIPLAKLVNMSVGFSSDSPPLQKAIQSLYTSGVIMVASAGNRCAQSPGQEDGGGDECVGGPALVCDPTQTAVKYPAAYPWVLAVAATDFYDDITAYSLSGTQVDVAAPGGSKATGIRILSTHTGGGYGWGSGTSQAAAHVTGAVALALQLQPGLSFTEVRSVLQTTAVDLGYPSTQQGAGLINVSHMVDALR
jgi:subtilisin family serine protease